MSTKSNPLRKKPYQSSFSSSHSGSLGVKLIIVCVLVVLMAIPAMFISYISYERSGRADDVTREVSARYGGEQYISGPILTAPYIQTDSQGRLSESGNYVIFASNGHAEFSNIETEIRHRSLFKVPTYHSEGVLTGSFFTRPISEEISGMEIDWKRAKIVMALSDVRGLKKDVKLTLPDGRVRKFEPASFDNGIRHVASETARDILKQPRAYKPKRYQAKNFQSYGWLNQSLAQTYLSVPIGDLPVRGRLLK